ncbi:MAG: FAD-binding protein [Gammaproteobacteria bacterium]
MRLTGWGRFPVAECSVARPVTVSAAMQAIQLSKVPLTVRGMGRSYGDAALGDNVIDTRSLHHLFEFDESSGELLCAAGTTVAKIISLLGPRGFMPAVVPGTADVSVGGAVASDVHGKNHHRDGSFGDFVTRLDVVTASGELVSCSPVADRALFDATIGGMGLTGLIVRVGLRLRRIASGMIDQDLRATHSLDETLDALDVAAAAAYVVAWIDVHGSASRRGRGLVMSGEHAVDDAPLATTRAALEIPFELPSGLINRPLTRMFNAGYYMRGRRRGASGRVPLHAFFFPLDGLGSWHRLYGKSGFVQHQSVVPLQARGVLSAMLDVIEAAGVACPLAVLKRLGTESGRPLSFPMAGYTMALDFPRSARTLEMMSRLDEIVAAVGGRIYLAKDACMSARMLRAGYPGLDAFQTTRERVDATGRFTSLQAARLGL